jgi:hypothetical protein
MVPKDGNLCRGIAPKKVSENDASRTSRYNPHQNAPKSLRFPAHEPICLNHGQRDRKRTLPDPRQRIPGILQSGQPDRLRIDLPNPNRPVPRLAARKRTDSHHPTGHQRATRFPGSRLERKPSCKFRSHQRERKPCCPEPGNLSPLLCDRWKRHPSICRHNDPLPSR